MASNPSSSSTSSSIHPTDGFISKLRTAASAEKALIRPTEFYIESNGVDSNSYNVTGWKTQEFAYRLNSKLDSRLPTLARGLFTTKVHHSDSVEANQDGAQPRSNQQNRIAVRGYDKFFNLDEMPWTSVSTPYSECRVMRTFSPFCLLIFWNLLNSSLLLISLFYHHFKICKSASFNRKILSSTISIDLQREWLHHLHFFSISKKIADHFKELFGKET